MKQAFLYFLNEVFQNHDLQRMLIGEEGPLSVSMDL